MEDYSKQTHQEDLKAVQTLLTALMKLAQENALTEPNAPVVLVGTINTDVLEMQFTSPGTKYSMRFFPIFIYDALGVRKNAFNIEFDVRTGKVNDSVQYSKQGKYLGGHIQFWHNHERYMAAADSLLALVQMGRAWRLVAYEESKTSKDGRL